ncbi:MAG: tetratricopeptide repeat protein [Silvibacterium sp.]
MEPRLNHPLLRFGPYEVDISMGELRRDGSRIHIQEKPLRVLAALAEHQGELVTRAELQKYLWNGEAFVDFENGLNTAVRKLRIALSDESEVPRYIETVPRRGYRFLAPVEIVNGEADLKARPLTSAASLPVMPIPETSAATARARSIPIPGPPARRWVRFLVLSAAIFAIVGAIAVWFTYGRPVYSFNSRDSVLVADFENQTGDPRFDQALETAFTVSMEQSRHANVFPRARLAPVLARMGEGPNERITPALGREICQRENIRGLITASITRTGEEYAISAELIDPQSGDTVRSYSERSYGESHILDALDVIAADIRRDLGESLYQIHKNNQPLPEVTTTSLDALKEYADGTSLWHAGKYRDAVTLLRAAIETDPKFAMAHAALGDAYYSYIFNNSQQGDQEYQKALALASRTTERERMNIQVNYADDRGHVQEADSLYQIFLKHYPDDWVMRSNYARFLRLHDHADEAIAQYREMLRVAPNDARTEIELATAYRTLGLFPESIDAYSRAFQIDPLYLNTGDISREYGFTLVQNGQVQKAEELFTSLLGDPKTRESGLRSLALLDLYRGKYASARPLLEEAMAYDEGLKTEPVGVAREHLLLAILAAGEGDARQQRSQLDSVMANFKALPAKVTLGAWVGSEYLRAGLPQQAEQIAAMITPLVDGRNPEQVAYAHFLQGEIALEQGDNDKAIQLISLSQQEKSTPYNMEGLARAYQLSGKIALAANQYVKFITNPDVHPGWEPQQRWLAAHYTLASDYLALGNPIQARKALNPLLTLWNDADQNLPLRKQAVELSARLR